MSALEAELEPLIVIVSFAMMSLFLCTVMSGGIPHPAPPLALRVERKVPKHSGYGSRSYQPALAGARSSLSLL